MKRKRIFSLLLCVVMLLSCFMAVPQEVGAETFTSGDWEYTGSVDGKATIVGYNGTAMEVTIPGTLDGYTVTGIAERAFQNSSVTNITIPNGVWFIGPDAFSGCSKLKKIVIPNSVIMIWRGAFMDCSSLESITIPNSVLNIWCQAC